VHIPLCRVQPDAAFSLKSEGEGLSAVEAEAVGRWRRVITQVAIEEMGHLAAVWNITAALGGQPRFGRGNFPLDPGYLPAGIVVKLAPFSEDVLQHFVHLERPVGLDETEGEGFAPEHLFRRDTGQHGRLTPMPMDYETVGVFYERLGQLLPAFSAQHGDSNAFCRDPALQLSPPELDLGGAKPVLCLKTALQAFAAIVTQGEGAAADSRDSHFQKFVAVREEYRQLKAANPGFTPAHPAATNPVLRKPPIPAGKVWLEDADAVATVDLANSCYQLMLRLLGYAYGIRRPSPENGGALDLGIALMRACTLLGEKAARLPAGPSNPGCNAGMSSTALRDSAPFAPGAGAHRFFIERHEEFAAAGETLAKDGEARAMAAAKLLAVRDGPLAIDPQTDGPLKVRGNLEITAGTGRVVARVQSALLCRCGGSANKPSVMARI
jgi:hypothetical protein